MIDERSTAVRVSFPSDQIGDVELAVHYPGHMSMTLDWPMALRYALTVLRAVAQAEHDAAVLGQMQKQFQFSPEVAAYAVQRLREQRPALDAEALGVLRIQPSVTTRSCTPFLRCSTVGGSLHWIWPVSIAIEHATNILLCSPAADLTVAYWKFLVGQMRLDDDQAKGAVADLSQWHWTAGAESDY